ncbi:hypothetical protein GCM10010398_69310 [Streptomyces fimbriatus]
MGGRDRVLTHPIRRRLCTGRRAAQAGRPASGSRERRTGDGPAAAGAGDLKAQKEAVDAQIRRLLAYGREFHGSRPYGLEELARRAGYSFSGVRTAYGETEIRQVAAQTGRKPNRPRRDTAKEGR